MKGFTQPDLEIHMVSTDPVPRMIPLNVWNSKTEEWGIAAFPPEPQQVMVNGQIVQNYGIPPEITRWCYIPEAEGTVE